MKIAFLFIVKDRIHKIDLWKQYFAGSEELYSCYIVSKSDIVENDIPNVINLPDKYDSDYGGVKYVKTVIFMLKEALANKKNFKFVLFTESCIPITNFKCFYSHLTKNDSAFINMMYVSDEYWKAGAHRYTQLSRRDIKRSEWYGHNAQGITFNRKLAKFLISTKSRLSNVTNVYNIDEHYYAYAIIANKMKFSDFNIDYSSLIFVNWQDKSESKKYRPYPKTYLNIDNELVKLFREQQYFFMRKIAPETEIDIAACISN